MISIFILILSLALQFVAVFLALRLIKITGRSLSWGLIAAAITLMAVRRLISVVEFLVNGAALKPDIYAESVALLISVLMVAGIASITPFFSEIRKRNDQLAESEERYRTLFDCAPDAIIIADLDSGQIVDVNPQAVGLIGRSRKELIGMHQSRLHPSTIADYTRASFERHVEEARSGLISEPFEHVVLRADKTEVPVEVTVQMVEMGGRELIQGIFRDISERKQAELKLRKNELAFRRLAENSPDVIVRYDREGRRIYVNPEFERVNHLTAEQVYGKTPHELSSELKPKADVFTEKLMAAMQSGQVSKIDLSWDKNGKPVWWFVRIVPEFDADGKVTSALTIWSDITERNKAEQERMQLGMQNRLILDSAGEGIYGLDIDGRCTFANPAALQLLGISAEELLGQPTHPLFHHTKADGNTYPEKECPVHAARKQGVMQRGSDLYWRKDGSSFPVEFISTPIRETGKITGAVVTFRDISELKLAEEQLRRSAEGLKEAQRIAHLGSWHMNLATNEVFWSEELYKMYGFDPALPPPLYTESMKLFTPESWERLSASIARCAETGLSYELELEMVPKTGGTAWMQARGELVRDEHGAPIQVRGVAMDITERKLAESELREREMHSQSLLRLARKMEASQSYGEVLNAAQDEVKQIFGYQSLWVYLFTDDKQYLKAMVAGGPISDTVMSEEGTATLTIKGDRMLEEIAASKEIVLVEDARTDDRVNKEIVARLGMRTIVNIPIMLIDRHMGCIGTGTFGEEGVRVPTLAEQKYLAAMASHIAVALDRIHLTVERAKAEGALKEREEFLASVIENIPDMIFIKDAKDLRFTKLNKAGEELLGYGREELLGKNDYDFFSREQAEFFTAKDRQVLEGAQLYDIPEEPINTKNGIRLLHTKKIPILNKQGKPTYLLGISEDITERKQIEETMFEAQQMFRTLVESSPDIITRYDRDCRRTYINPTYLKVAKMNDHDLLGTAPAQRSPLPADSAAILQALLRKVLDRGVIDSVDVVWRMPDNIDHWYNVYAFPEFDRAGQVVSVMTVSRDITARKQAEEEIRKLNRELEQRVTARTADLEAANKELESFSYSVSHDLRTPLRAIDGFSHILLDDYADKLDDEGKRLLNVVRDNTGRMGQLIDDILQFSRTGRLELAFAEIDMEKLAREVVEELRPVIGAGNKLQLKIEPLPKVIGDRAMMHQVFVNLLSNAIKFSRRMEVPEVQVGATAGANETIYHVKDNGVGFDMQYADKLFGVFQRLHSMSEFEGTGIGLAIVKRIITRHGGRVWAEGKVNEGATIYFALPSSRENRNG